MDQEAEMTKQEWIDASNGEGSRCEHGIRWPHECRDCFDKLEVRKVKPQQFAQVVKAGRGWLVTRNSATLASTDYERVAHEIKDALNAKLSETGSRDSQTMIALHDQVHKLTKALEQCVQVTKAWHGDDAFDLYFNHSPEMKLIRDVLGKMPEEA